MLRNDRALAFLALCAPIAYLLLLGVKPYPGDVILKTSLCGLLALLAWRHEKRLLAVALLFSAMGDALLDLNSANLFVPALASFLVTHVLYATMFWRGAKLRITQLQVWRLMLLVLVPMFAIAYTVVLWPKLGNLSLPVACYIAAIVAMTLLSLRLPVTVVPIGAGLFLISDSLIALEKFLWQANWIGPTIWVTYAAAQLLIAYGMMMKHRHAPI